MTQLPEYKVSKNEDTYEELMALIEYSQGLLSLIIVACDDLPLRQRTIDLYEGEARTLGIQTERIVLGTEPSLRAGLVRLGLPAKSPAVVTVTGAEWLLRVKTRSTDEQSDLDKFFGYLQWTREALLEFPYPIVLWVTYPILKEMSHRARDFWSWRKAVLRFATESTESTRIDPQNRPLERRIDRPDDDSYISPPASIRSEIDKLESSDPDSPNLATFYQQLADIYTRRIDRGIATDIDREQQQAIDAFEKAIDLYRKFNQQSALAIALNNFGYFLFDRSRYAEAIEFHQQSLEIKRQIGDARGEAASLGNLGNAYYSLSEYRRAIEFHQQSLELQHQIGTVAGEANSLVGLGKAYYSLGEYRRAIEFYQQSLEIQRQIGNVGGEADSLNNLGNAYHALGEYQRAIEFHQQSLEIQRQIGNVGGEANSLNNLGITYRLLGEYQQAIEFLQESLEIQRRIGDVRCEANSLGNLGITYRLLKEYQQAIEFYQQSLELQRRIGDIRGEASSLNNLGNAYAYNSSGEYQRAIEFYRQSLELQRRISDVRGEAASCFNLGFVLAKLEHKQEAIEFYQQARQLYQNMGLDADVKDCDNQIDKLQQ